MPLPPFRHPKTTAALAVFLAALAGVFANREDLLWKFRIGGIAKDGHLESLAPPAEYLEKPLKDRNYPLLAKRSDDVSSVLEERSLRNEFREVAELLDPTEKDSACSQKIFTEGGSAFARYCESRTLAGPPEKGAYDCGNLRFEENARACREKNDRILTETPDSHCSKIECEIDNAIYRSKRRALADCADIHPAFLSECLKTLEAYRKFEKDRSVFSRPGLEDVLAGKTASPAMAAARDSVLESSPASCSSLSNPQTRGECERLAKELFSYVQSRDLRERFERISNALAEREGPTVSPQ